MAEWKYYKHHGSTEAFEMSRETLAPPHAKTVSWPSLPNDDNRTLVDWQRYEIPDKDYDDTEPVLRSRRNPDDDYEYPSSWKLVLITIGLCFCVFCMALDNTIIATAIPEITSQFNSVEDVGWYGSGYLLPSCALTLIFGKLYTFFSIKWVYLVALFIFELGSFVCGIAPNSIGLIMGRAVAGIGGAGLFSGSVLIVTQTVPLRRRPIYTGMLGAMFGIASVAGPLMGGALTDRASWRWCFYINLPFGAITALFVMLFFKAPKPVKVMHGWRDLLSELDLPGAFFFLPAVICGLLALQWGGIKYEWKDTRIIILFVCCGAFAVFFTIVQVWRQDKATIPPRLIKNRNMMGSAWFAFAIGCCFFIYVYYVSAIPPWSVIFILANSLQLPLWFQAVKGASATKSGIMNLPMILSVVVVSVIAGGLVTWLGQYAPFMIACSVIMTVGAGMLTILEPDSNHREWIGYQALFGIGLGMGIQQPMIVVQTALAGGDVPSATAINSFCQTLGGALFISVGQNVWSNELVKKMTDTVPPLEIAKATNAGATLLRDTVSEEWLPAVLKAYSDAITEAFFPGVAMGGLSLIGALAVEWISVRGRKIEMGPV